MGGRPGARRGLFPALAFPALAVAAVPASALAGAGDPVRAGGVLEARVAQDPVALSVTYTRGGRLLRSSAGTGADAPGAFGLRTGGRWRQATRVLEQSRSGAALQATLATTDPAGRRLALRVAPNAAGVLSVKAWVLGDTAGVEAVGASFAAPAGARYLGFGERSNAVDQTGNEVESFVGEGPYASAQEYDTVAGAIPPWGLHRRADATYFPMPWLLSTSGYGVLVDDTRTSRFALPGRRGGSWSVSVDSPSLALRVFAGPTPAQVLRRLTTRTGRQPAPAAPWLLGPWFQTGHGNESPDEQDYVRILRRADAPVSAAETHMRYMPCGADRGREQSERARTAAFHAAGLASLTYLREAVCADDASAYAEGTQKGVFTKRADGSVYSYRAFVGGRVTDVAQIDFTAPGADAFHGSLLGRAVANGHDGWMEDYGEYTPPDSVSADGRPGTEMHNLYPVLYHRSGFRFARAQKRPIARFVRSGWTGVHPYAQIVWGGDPATRWGYDGLQSAVTQALSMGLSGISLWGSDVGGFFSLTAEEKLTPELLARWIEFGAVSGVMRTKAEGIGVGLKDRPQIWERPTLPLWRRYAKLRTQLYPYLVAADREYRRSGLPIMRHLSLVAPGDRRAAGVQDAFGFGPSLLAAPVLRPGRRSRRTYLPRGRWVDLWRSAAFESRSGALALGRARVLSGGRSVSTPAPLDELPLFARAGAVLPLLPADVDTLAGYGDAPGLVKLGDRRDRLTLLAFPRGTSSARFGTDGELRSRERSGAWELSLRSPDVRRYDLQASLQTLRDPIRPCRVLLDGRPLSRARWRHDRRTGVLKATVRSRGRAAELRVLACS